MASATRAGRGPPACWAWPRSSPCCFPGGTTRSMWREGSWSATWPPACCRADGRYSGWRSPGRKLVAEGHGVAEIALFVGDAPAVEADEARLAGQALDPVGLGA